MSNVLATMRTVVVANYSEEWPLHFAEVRAVLHGVLEPNRIAVEHIGSTSVPGLSAKPIIDVLLGADSLGTIENAIEGLARHDYEYVSKYEDEFPARRYFVKAASHSALRVNLHAVVRDSQFWLEHIAFRDGSEVGGSTSWLARRSGAFFHVVALGLAPQLLHADQAVRFQPRVEGPPARVA